MNSESESEKSDIYPRTRWSIVIDAGSTNAEQGRPAFGELFELYRHAIFLTVRRFGSMRQQLWDHQEAEDLTQAYFIHLMTNGYLRQADRAKGQFRAFIQKDLGLFLRNEYRKCLADKRGGKAIIVSIDEGEESPGGTDLEGGLDSDSHLDREWAKATLENSRDRVRASYQARGQLGLFEALAPNLDKDLGSSSSREAAELLGMEANAVKVALHRLRARFGRALEDLVSDTLLEPTRENVMAEIRYLFSRLQP